MAKEKPKDDVVKEIVDLDKLRVACIARAAELTDNDRILDVMVAYLADIELTAGKCRIRDQVHHRGRSGRRGFDFNLGVSEVADLSLLRGSELVLIPAFCSSVDDTKNLALEVGADWNCGMTGKVGHATVTLNRRIYLGRSYCAAAALLMAVLKASEGDR